MTNAHEESFTPEQEAPLEDNQLADDQGTIGEEGLEEPEVEVGSDLEGDAGEGNSDEGGAEEGREARKSRAEAQIARLKEENKRLKEDKRSAERQSKLGSSSADIMAKALLAATHEIKEPDAQEEALRLADKFDMSIDEMMEDQDYRNRIQSVQKRIIQNRKVAASTGGTAQKKKGAEYYADYFKKNQSFPADAPLEVRNQAIDMLTRRGKQPWQR